MGLQHAIRLLLVACIAMPIVMPSDAIGTAMCPCAASSHHEAGTDDCCEHEADKQSTPIDSDSRHSSDDCCNTCPICHSIVKTIAAPSPRLNLLPTAIGDLSARPIDAYGSSWVLSIFRPPSQ